MSALNYIGTSYIRIWAENSDDYGIVCCGKGSKAIRKSQIILFITLRSIILKIQMFPNFLRRLINPKNFFLPIFLVLSPKIMGGGRAHFKFVPEQDLGGSGYI